MARKLSLEERVSIEQQIAGITAFLDNCYDSMAHDVEIRWTVRDGWDPIKNNEHKSYDLPDYIDRKGKLTRIEVGFGDAYWGSSSLGRMMHEAAYEWREKLLMRLKEDGAERTVADLYA